MNRRQLLINMGAMVAGCGRTSQDGDTDGEWDAGTGGASAGSGFDAGDIDASGGLDDGDSTGCDPLRRHCAVFDSASVGPLPGAAVFGSAAGLSPSTFCSAA